MNKFFQLFAIIGILGISALISFVLWKTKPEAAKKETKISFPVVKVLPVKLETIPIKIPSQGIVESERRSVIASEIAGKVISVSEKFDVGGVFAKNEFILKLDDSDYLAALAQAKATLAETLANLATEEARSEQAKRDWEQLGNGGPPGDLTQRGPQLRSARARVDAAAAAIKKAENDLRRTSISAPFPSAVSKTRTELGSYLTPGAPVAELFQTGPYEVRLPLSIDEFQFLKLNEKGEPAGEVAISKSAAGITTRWQANIVRTEREVSRLSRSIYVVAEIDSLPGKRGIFLQPGLFVEAIIGGQVASGIARVPFPAFLDLNRVVVVDPGDRIVFRQVTVLRREGDMVLVSEGLKDGDRLCMTELPGLIEGTKVTTLPWKSDDEKTGENRRVELKP